jgi:valacyclovir hydrolase
MSPPQQFQAIRDGISLAYWDIGSGSPVVLLHGFTGTARGHLDDLIQTLAAEHRVIAPDLRGYGASRPPDRTFPPDFYERDALDVASLLDALALGPAVVMGFSDGSEVAVLLAALRPDLVRGVVAWGISGVISPEELDKVEGWLPVSDWGPEHERWRQEIIRLQGADQVEPMVEGWVKAARAITAAGGNICLDQAPSIRCPVLLLNGVGEIGNTPRDVTLLCGAIPTCRLVFVPNCGHAIQDDQPEELRRHIQAFLTELDTAEA